MNTHPSPRPDAGKGRTHWLDAERLRVYPRIFLGLFAVAAVAYGLLLHDGMGFRG